MQDPVPGGIDMLETASRNVHIRAAQGRDMLAHACTAIAAAAGFAALAGWVLDMPLLASLRSDWIPMAPSTALLFVLYAGALHYVRRPSGRRAALRTGIGVGSAGALIGLVLFLLSSRGIYLAAERLGLGATATVHGAPTGHMSPMTAFCFAVAGLSLVASLWSTPARRWPAIAGFWLAGLMAFASAVFLLAYVFGMPLFYEGPLIPPALPTTVALAALGAALLELAGRRAWARDPGLSAAERRQSRYFVLVFALMAAGIVITGTVYFRSQLAQRRMAIESQLSAVATLKIGEMVRWREQRFGDAMLFHRNPAFGDLMQRALGPFPDAQAEQRLRIWLQQARDGLGYEKVSLFDARAVARVSVPDGPPSAHELDQARRALGSDQVGLEDFHRDPVTGAPHMLLLVPVLNDAAGSRSIGVVMLQIDPSRHLYPLIQHWPVPSRTAETLLVRRDGDDVLFLSDLRFRNNTALALRFPLTRTDLPAAMAVLGQQGVVEGIDYAGLPVLAAVGPVPGTPWFMVARMSSREAFGQLAQNMGLAAGAVAAVLFSAALALGVIWRQRRAMQLQERSRADILAQSARELARANAALEASARDLARSNLELEQFAYIASHDLQEPLRMVVGYVQLMQKRLAGGLDAETAEFMGFAVDGALRMQALIQDVLAYSRVTTQGRPFEPVDGAAALEEARTLLAGRIAATGAQIDAQPLPVVMADRTQLVQLFQNLLGNAIKFCRDRAPRVRVDAAHEPGRWRFSVTDNGIGIAPEYREQVFVIFKRLHTRREYPGTGIGLAICKRIVERHGGEIGIDPAPGGGSVFWFTLPEEPIP